MKPIAIARGAYARRPRAAALPLILTLVVPALPAVAQSAGQGRAQVGAQSGTHGVAQGAAPLRLTLDDAARVGASRSAASEAARARASGAAARVGQQRSALLPSLSSTTQAGAHTYNTATLGLDIPAQPGQPPVFDPDGEISSPVHTVDIRSRVTQTVLDLPAVARVKSAQAEAEASRAAADDAAREAAHRSALAYIQVLRADGHLQARLADSALAADLLDIARRQREAGTGVALDVTRAEAQLASVRSQLIAARAARARSRIDLLRALSLPLDTPLELADSLEHSRTAEVTLPEDEAVRRALQRRRDLRAADAGVEAARADVRAVRSERIPQVALFADRGMSGDAADNLLGTYSYGVQLSVSMFDGFRRQSRTAERRAAEREADIRRRDLRLEVEAEVRTALLDVASAREQVEAARERLRLAEQEVSQARARFAAGVADNGDVDAALLALNRARSAMVDALAARAEAGVTLRTAEGGN